MGALEVIASIFAILTLVKLGLFFLAPDIIKKHALWWFKRSKGLWLFEILAVLIVGYYVLTALTVIQVLSVLFLAHVLLGLFFLSYPKAMEKFYKDILKQGMRKALLPLLVYAGLSIWALYVLFL